MKGMQKIRHGSSFSGAVNYALERDHAHKKDPGQIIGGNLDTSTPEAIIRQLETAGELRPDITKPVWHQSLRLPKNEHLTDDKWTELADEYMQKIGFSDRNPRVYVKHNDTAGEHIHIIASRINYNGQCHNASHESMKSTPIIHDLEQKYGLTQTKKPEIISKNGKPTYLKQSSYDKKRITKNEKEKALREQELPDRLKIKKTIDQTTKKLGDESFEKTNYRSIPAKDFIEKLDEQGIKAYPNISDTTGRFNGFSYGIDDIYFKGSQIGPEYTPKGLRIQGVSLENPEDIKALQTAKRHNKPSYDKHKENETMKNEAQKVKSVSTEQDDTPDYLSALENYNPAKKKEEIDNEEKPKPKTSHGLTL